MREQIGHPAVAFLTRLHPRTGRIVADVVAVERDAEAVDQALRRLPITGHSRGVGLQRRHHQVVHHTHLFVATHTLRRFSHLASRLRLWHGEPLLLLGKADLDVADRFEVFVKFVRVVAAQSPGEILRIHEHGVENASLLFELGLPNLERRRLIREELVECDDGVVDTSDGLALTVPGERQARAMAVPGAAQCQRREPRLLAELLGRHLVDGDRVVEALAGNAKLVGPRQPERAARVGIKRMFVKRVLNDRDVFPVPFKRLETVGQGPFGSRLVLIGIPGLFRHAPADADEDHAFRPSGRRGGRCESPEAQRRETRQGDE